MLAATLEQIQHFAPRKRAMYVRITVAGLAAIVVCKAFRFLEGGFWDAGNATDFGAFYIVAQRVWLGDVDLTYQFSSFMKMQAEASDGASGFMPWTYPPQFDLILSPLAFLPGWAAYLLFTSVTLAAYLMTLRAIATNNFAQVLIILFPAIATTIGSGQNGFLTGALMGLVCINGERRQALAGIALGAMVIKPHLAIAAGVYMLLMQRWTAIAVAVATVVASSLICTVAFGPHIWVVWLDGLKDSAAYLEQGQYPLFRMISAYATLYTAGASSTVAFWGQAATACLALGALAFSAARGPTSRFALGVATLTSVMISPYAYDYDLPIVGIALALLLPDLSTLTTLRERGIVYGLLVLAGGYGMLQSARLATGHGDDLHRYETPAVTGAALVAVLAILLWSIVRNDIRQRLSSR